MGPSNRTVLLENGTVVGGKWEILEHIATGGKGEVYRARQTNLDREVVVKTVSVEYLAEFGGDPEEIETEMKRFHREAMAMAQASHPHVVQVYDQDSMVVAAHGIERTVQYVVMEYVPGSTLRSTMLDEGFGSNERAAREWIRDYFLPVLEGIEYVHELGIVHRDLKPENVLLAGTTPKITDFGIAGGVRWQHLTRSHHVEGTIPYMAPEQFMDLGETDVRGDVYALGKILYEAMCGKMVDTRTACPLKSVCLSNPQTQFLRGLNQIISQATAEERKQRTPSVKAFREDLVRLLQEAEVAERPLLRGLHRSQVVAAVAVILVVVAASNVYHHLIMTHEAPMPSDTPTPEVSAPIDSEKARGQESLLPQSETPVATLSGRDGSSMRLVPAGYVQVAVFSGSHAWKLVAVAPFYRYPAKVTNEEYVEFLNRIPARTKVKDGVVEGDGVPWLLLSSASGTRVPIIYQGGRFSVGDDSSASLPVVKVTGHGASAYAELYGKRLPTELEWALAEGREHGSRKQGPEHRPGATPPSDGLEAEMEQWLGGYPTVDTSSQLPRGQSRLEPGPDGTRGPDSAGGEWGLRSPLSPDAGGQYVILGGPRGSMLQGSILIPGAAQDPARAFDDVGFRCVAGVNGTGK